MPRKKNKRIYFGKDTQDAIVRYNKEKNPIIRNDIYRDGIEYAFDKLVENIINTFKFSYFDAHFNDVKNEVVSFLVLNMHKYDETKGFKAFSYFSVITKNYLIVLNNNNYKKLKLQDDISVLDGRKDTSSKDVLGESSVETFVREMAMYFDENISKMFKKDKDRLIAYSIIDLIKDVKSLENFNKKAIYILIREMTGENTSKITKVLNKLKSKYSSLYETFHNNGTIMT